MLGGIGQTVMYRRLEREGGREGRKEGGRVQWCVSIIRSRRIDSSSSENSFKSTGSRAGRREKANAKKREL